MRPYNKYGYCSYILCYVDDIMVIHNDSLSILKKIEKYFTLKPLLVGDPDIYLGVNFRIMTMPDVVWS